MVDNHIEDIMRALDLVKTKGSPFSIKPKHWWSYLNPFWWKTKTYC